MSRIVLTRWPDKQERFVVGWDHPCGGCFWQEFAPDPARDPKTGEVDWERAESEGWEEVLRDGGMFPGIPYHDFREAVPEDLRSLVTDEVMALLLKHAEDPDSGYNKGTVDLSSQVTRA